MRAWLHDTLDVSIAEQVKSVALRSRGSVVARVTSFFFVVVAFHLVGHGELTYVFLAAIVLNEMQSAYLDNYCIRQFEELRKFEVVGYILSRVISSFCYMSVGFVATTASSSAVVMTGLLWVICVLNFNSMYYARYPIFHSISFIPMGSAVLLFVFILGDKPFEASGPYESLIPLFGAAVLLKTMHAQVRSNQKTDAELEDMRHAAASRLGALEYIAGHDDLTGLLNRSAFNERLQNRLDHATTPNGPFGFLSLDLDGFKPINDCFGHAAGDALLKEVSARLLNTVGRSGFVARVGGDEFAVVLPKMSDLDTIEDITLDLIRVVGLPVKYDDTELSVGTSVGIVIVDETLDTSEKIMAAADEALYKAKEIKKSSFVQYDPALVKKRVSINERNIIEAAIKDRIIKPFYQPKFCLESGKVVGFEALARWPLDPEQPSESADFVVKIAELGLLSDFTYHIARQVFTDIRTLIDEGYDPGQVSLNISEVTLSTLNGLEDLQWLLAEYASVVPHITLEITEDVFIARTGVRIRDSIHELRAIGVRISLDDFGTGFASFQHLRQLEFDELKIDTQFVQGLGIDATANVIVDGFLSIAQGLGVSVVAEGVETEAQRKYLADRGCPVAQGFLHSKAQPLNDIRKYLKTTDQTATG